MYHSIDGYESKTYDRDMVILPVYVCAVLKMATLCSRLKSSGDLIRAINQDATEGEGNSEVILDYNNPLKTVVLRHYNLQNSSIG